MQTTPQDSPGTLVLWRKRSLWNSSLITPGAPNANGVGKISFFDRSRSLRSRSFTAENLCPSATVVRVHNGAVAEKYAVSATRCLLWKSVYHTYGLLPRYMYVTRNIACSLCDSWAYCNDACTQLCRYNGIKRGSWWKCSTRDLSALFVQQDNISTDTERRAGLSAIAEPLVTEPEL